MNIWRTGHNLIYSIFFLSKNEMDILKYKQHIHFCLKCASRTDNVSHNYTENG